MFEIISDAEIEKKNMNEKPAFETPKGEDGKVKLPIYVKEIYGKIYEDTKVSKFLDNVRLLRFLTLGNNRKLIESALKEIHQNNKVLQIGGTFGDQIEQTAEKIGHYGRYDMVDVSETQMQRLEDKYKYLFPQMNFILKDGTEPMEEKYDVVLCYMLLHELPILTKIKMVNNALASVNETGKVVFIDYYNPEKWHPLRYFVRMFNRLYQPFAEKLWDREIHTFADKDKKNDFFWKKLTFFGGMYQKVVASKKDEKIL